MSSTVDLLTRPQSDYTSLMYNLLVSFQGWKPAKDSISKSRVFEHTSNHICEQFSTDSKIDFDSLLNLPTLFMPEKGGAGQQLGRVGRIFKVSQIGDEIHFEYSLEHDLSPIPMSALVANASQFQISNFAFSRSHWAVKDVDLYQTLCRINQTPRFLPKVFNLSDKPEESDLVSVMMPFASGFDEVYGAIQKSAELESMRCLRADDIWDNDAIIQDVIDLISCSKIVICDCTGRNPNVFYEAGIAHTLGKNVILIAQSKSDIPFDVSHIRYVEYANNPEGRKALAKSLKKRINSLAS